MKPLISSKIAGIIYALATGTFGVLHFMNVDAMKASVPDYMPGDGSIWIYFTGACMILAAIAIIINKFTRLACYLLAAMFLIFVSISLTKAIDLILPYVSSPVQLLFPPLQK